MSELIDRLDVWLVPVRLRRPHVMSFGSVPDVQLVVARLTTTGGVSGFGEVTILGGPSWGEESAESVFACATRYLAPAVLGADALHLERTTAGFRRVRDNRFAKACLEIGLQDLRARVLGRPLSVLLGAGRTEPLPMSWSLASNDAAAEADEFDEVFARGFRIVKVKTGALPVADDVRRVAALREHIGDRAALRVDANQGWTRAEAGFALPRLAELGVDYVEQPLDRADIEGMAALQAGSAMPLAADESLQTLREAARLVDADAARVFIYKVAKHGGITATLDVAHFAREHGIGGYLGNMIESSLGTAAYLAASAGGMDMAWGCELFGPLLLADDLVAEPLLPVDGAISPPAGPGLGVEVDVEKLAALATEHVTLRPTAG